MGSIESDRISTASDDDLYKAIRERAYQLWLDEGRPDGRADVHWEMARELVAIEENYRETLLPNPSAGFNDSPYSEPVEGASIQQNLGEFPTLTDQGEETTFPARQHAIDADEMPSSPPTKRGGRRAASA